MAQLFHVEIISATRKIYDGHVSSLAIPGISGSFGVLAGHAPMISSLAIGKLVCINGDGEENIIAVSGGFVEVNADKVLILADSAELAGQIDLERARQAKVRAESLLEKAQLDQETVDFERARASLMRAINRISIAEPRM